MPSPNPGTTGPRPPALVCTEIDACATLCKDGAGTLDACVRLGELALAGRKLTAPDPSRALRAFRVACGLDTDWKKEITKTGEPRGCLQAADLLERGWLFDVEKDPVRARTVLDRAITLARDKCNDKDASRCDTAALALKARDRTQPAKSVLERIAYAERGCEARQPASCKVLEETSWLYDSHESLREDAKRLRAAARAGYAQACSNDGDAQACRQVMFSLDGNARMTATATIERRCKEGDREACVAIRRDLLIKYFKQPEKQMAASKEMIALCDGDGHSGCAQLAEALTAADVAKRFSLAVDVNAGLALAVRRCDLGDIPACRTAAAVHSPTGPLETLRDPVKFRGYADRACTLSGAGWCPECKDPTLPICIKRDIYREHDRCLSSVPEACQRIAARFDSGDGVERSITRAADYLRKGCDAADRSACVALDALCRKNPSLPVATCQQALIHSDVFYEAEYQLGAGGAADVIDPNKPAPGKPATPPPVTVGSVVAQTPTSYRRGKLDADLVVDIVLDRLRQAAIELVVDRLLTAERKARYRYLRDLLEQGAALLAEPSTLRREKFEDLGMIVVRAFVAANLIEGLYPTGKELLVAHEIGATATRGMTELRIDSKKPLPAKVHGYLVDVAYYWLGETQLFSKPSRTKTRSLDCPWSSGEGATMCKQLSERATAERIVGVDKMLDGLRLARALRDGGFSDVRRLIEATRRSNTVANFNATPGLTLRSWRARVIDDLRVKVANVRGGIDDIRALTDIKTYGENGPDIATLAVRAKGASLALSAASVRMAIGSDGVAQLYRILRLIDQAERDDGRSPTPIPPPPNDEIDNIGAELPQVPDAAGETPKGGAEPKGGKDAKKDKKPPPAKKAKQDKTARNEAELPRPTIGRFDARVLFLTKLRGDAIAGITAWGTPNIDKVNQRLSLVSIQVDTVTPKVNKLESAIANVTGMFNSRFPTARYDVGNLPLYALPDLTRELRVVSKALIELDEALHVGFPGEGVQAQVQFARSATVRLLGFLHLMGRVARSSQLSQKTGDVIDALRTLGTYSLGDVFDAPLYDVLEPVLDSIQTHEPMTLEMLYAVIAHVRLDTLIAKLRGEGNPCEDERSVDCWSTRLIHALQESVERDGGNLRIDGGKFAQRLAQHGDDFRRRHKWRGFLHLTVGVGALYSDPVGDMGAARRPVPLISEQIGFGLASPSFFKNRLTFKIGAAASGLLYRAALDSEESKAIMVHPVFLAVDIGKLVEFYVSPGMLMLYPPEGDRETQFRWGASAGISVPLSAYFERL